MVLGLDESISSALALRGSKESFLQLDNNQISWQLEVTNKTNDFIIRDVLRNQPRFVIKEDDSVNVFGGFSTDFLNAGQSLHVGNELKVNAPTRFTALGGTRPAYLCVDTADQQSLSAVLFVRCLVNQTKNLIGLL